eukprot:TRINITY_DN34009_c0_g1_i1.p1 TRINITY_DN34009_c0_g1~~TRINITY_DN34009_c0_g1_i1.p1  ORF type:complete len:395 (-),score=73.97 TRINITY_DN34009_c0_g1_i1:326-1459(-)
MADGGLGPSWVVESLNASSLLDADYRGSGGGGGSAQQRGSSVDGLVARRTRLSGAVHALRVERERQYLPIPDVPLRQATAQRENLELQMDRRHADLIARAKELDGITARAIRDCQEANAAERLARWRRSGLEAQEYAIAGLEPDAGFGDGVGIASWERQGASSSALLRWRQPPPPPAALLDSSSMHAALSSSLHLEDLSANWLQPMPTEGGRSVSSSMHVAALSPSPLASPAANSSAYAVMRPAVYVDSPRRRPSPSRLLGSPYRPILPHRAEAAWVAETPKASRRVQSTPATERLPTAGTGARTALAETHGRLGTSLRDAPPDSLCRSLWPQRSLPADADFAALRARREHLAREIMLLSADSPSPAWSPGAAAWCR